MKKIKNQFNIYHSIENTLFLEKEDAKKLIKVVRIKEGEYFRALDGKGTEGIYIVKKIEKNSIIGELVEKNEKTEEKKIVIVCGLAKRKAIETITSFLTQIGKTDIIIVNTENSLKTEKKEKDKIIERLKRISIESSVQSEGILPEIRYEQSLGNIEYKENNTYIFLDKNGGKTLKEIKNELNGKDKIYIFIGPEGDFSETEKNLIKNKFKAFDVKVSNNILRTETAAIVAVSQVLAFI